jgi:hypothetical protein
MNEFNTVRLKRYAAVGIAAFGTIFQVAFDGASYGRELTPNLMMPPGHQLNLQQAVVVALANDFVSEHSLLRTRHFVIVSV